MYEDLIREIRIRQQRERLAQAEQALDQLNGAKKSVQSDRKLHWTQLPENRSRVEAWMRKMTRARKAA